MTIIPAFRATLKNDITDNQREKLAGDIRQLRGVVGVAFNQAADGEKYLHISHMPGTGTERAVAAMDGVQRTYPARF